MTIVIPQHQIEKLLHDGRPHREARVEYVFEAAIEDALDAQRLSYLHVIVAQDLGGRFHCMIHAAEMRLYFKFLQYVDSWGQTWEALRTQRPELDLENEVGIVLYDLHFVLPLNVVDALSRWRVGKVPANDDLDTKDTLRDPTLTDPKPPSDRAVLDRLVSLEGKVEFLLKQHRNV